MQSSRAVCAAVRVVGAPSRSSRFPRLAPRRRSAAAMATATATDTDVLATDARVSAVCGVRRVFTQVVALAHRGRGGCTGGATCGYSSSDSTTSQRPLLLLFAQLHFTRSTAGYSSECVAAHASQIPYAAGKRALLPTAQSA